ncbi:OSCP1 isoform X2 [Brachionus plicatilis]|uniref:OSCP1 isoform X2 n=1 Tax=Brachionus plicatilis TaxID=10195 RepID=A0A3M7P9U4_BRAPC|nr:OSCP1 isoform X2 [Brachionus plicatilis]
MSLRALPIVFLNLGGEMLYVLDQRLYAQKIQNEKGKKIMQDIISNMFSERFLDEVFRPQEMCHRSAFRILFERLAHASIMRLNQPSMDKLFDLMTMAVKYQTLLVSKPHEILLVTLNHLDSILEFVADSDYCVDLIEKCYKRLIKTYSDMDEFELQEIRHSILNCLQDLRVKVSVFLKEKIQNWNGTFALANEGPVACQDFIPGTIIYYENDHKKKSIFKESKFNPGSRYEPAIKEGSYERKGNRVTSLGLNIYSSKRPVDTILAPESNYQRVNVVSDMETCIPDPKSRAQLDLLCRLIGKSSSSSTKNNDFKLNLFNNEEEEFIYETQIQKVLIDDQSSKIVSFDGSNRHKDDRLNKIMNQFSHKGDKYEDDDDDRNRKSKPSRYKKMDEEDDDDDIVSMMDRLNRK